MREILFRGRFKGKYHSHWVEGVGVRMYEEGSSVLYTGNGAGRCVVDTKSVGQFTGLTDKNGKKIFEGDVVLWCGIKGIVVWEGHKFVIKSNLLWDFSDDDCIEVIGNIYDNPELMEDRA